MKHKHIVVITVASLILLGAAGAGLYYFFKPTKDFAQSRPDIMIAAPDLLREFSRDEASAIQKFVAGDKAIQVEGTIDEVRTNSDGTTDIVLSGEGVGSVMCSLVSGTHPPLQTGSRISVKGQCTGMQELIDTQVIMIRCVVVEE